MRYCSGGVAGGIPVEDSRRHNVAMRQELVILSLFIGHIVLFSTSASEFESNNFIQLVNTLYSNHY